MTAGRPRALGDGDMEVVDGLAPRVRTTRTPARGTAPRARERDELPSHRWSRRRCATRRADRRRSRREASGQEPGRPAAHPGIRRSRQTSASTSSRCALDSKPASFNHSSHSSRPKSPKTWWSWTTRTGASPSRRKTAKSTLVRRVRRVGIPRPFQVAKASISSVVTPVVRAVGERLARAVRNEERNTSGSNVGERGGEGGPQILLRRQVHDRVVDEHGVELASETECSRMSPCRCSQSGLIEPDTASISFERSVSVQA